MVNQAKNKCINCAEYKRCKDSLASWVFFIIGLIATIAIRVVTVLTHTHPLLGKAAWYVGVGGFFIFFIYKFRISQSRSVVIQEKQLMEKIKGKQQLNEDEYEIIASILCALSSNKEKINYFFIFAISAVALVLAVYFDFLR